MNAIVRDVNDLIAGDGNVGVVVDGDCRVAADENVMGNGDVMAAGDHQVAAKVVAEAQFVFFDGGVADGVQFNAGFSVADLQLVGRDDEVMRAHRRERNEDGGVESADVKTDTGTIHADVPLEALKFNFVWEASRPRFMSDVELPKIQEKAGGMFKLSGRLGDKKAKKEELVALDFRTQRGVVLLNVDPEMAPADLRERPLTEAARAIVRSGDSELV